MRSYCSTLGFVVASILTSAIAQAGEDKRLVQVPVAELVGAISNTDIDWGYVYHYRAPDKLRGASKLVARYCDSSAVPALVAALDDPQRFIAAHCLLAGLVPVSMEAGPRVYGGLTFDERGMALCTDTERLNLKCLWKVRVFVVSHIGPSR
jgi:hypothetical protein